MPVKIEKLTTRGKLVKYQILEILEKNPELAFNSEELEKLIEKSKSTITKNQSLSNDIKKLQQEIQFYKNKEQEK